MGINLPGLLRRGGDVRDVARRVRRSLDEERGGTHSTSQAARDIVGKGTSEVRKASGIFEDQKVILHSWTQRRVAAWPVNKPEFGAELPRALRTTVICSAGGREPRKGVRLDFPAVFGDPQDDFSDFAVALSWITPNGKSHLLWPPAPRFSAPSTDR